MKKNCENKNNIDFQFAYCFLRKQNKNNMVLDCENNNKTKTIRFNIVFSTLAPACTQIVHLPKSVFHSDLHYSRLLVSKSFSFGSITN